MANIHILAIIKISQCTEEPNQLRRRSTDLAAVVDEAGEVASLGCVHDVVQVDPEQVGGADTLKHDCAILKLFYSIL